MDGDAEEKMAAAGRELESLVASHARMARDREFVDVVRAVMSV